MNKITEIKKPKFDNRKFNGGQLDNGIKFSIVNDLHLEKSFVTICLKVGSFSDPIGYEGLAHFLEHMLFMGSKKYPDESYYHSKLNELGGYSNAYTDVMETVYFFNVYDNGLEEIFDIFSRFFIDPLFDPDSVAREINAINSEHKKNINQDMWREYQLRLNLMDKKSLVNTFVTGSLNSLQKPDIREQVIKFYKQYYTTNNISISIASSKPTKQIYEIIKKTFGHISKTLDSTNKLVITKPFITENKAKTFHLKSIANIYEISWIWEIPYQESFLDSKDFSILEMIITNKSDKSLYFHLKNKGFLHRINVEIRFEGVLIIKLKLTKEGYANLDYIELALYKCLNQIINTDLETYAKYYQQVMKINFDCINKFNSEDLCNMLAVNHHYHSTQNIFIGNFLIFKIKSNQEYYKLFTKYLNIENCMKIILAQVYNQNNFVYHILPEYEAEYAYIPVEKVKTFSNTKLEVIDNLCCFDITNEYLDIKTKLIKDLDKFDIPHLISERQWYGGCSKFGEPQIRILLQFNSNKFFNSAKSYILSNISCSILNFLVTVILYKPLELCYSIAFESNPTNSSINMIISGLNDVDKLKILIGDISNFIKNFDSQEQDDKLFNKISKAYIDNLIISFKESYQNTKYLNPWEYSSYIIRKYQISTEFSSEEIIQELELINYNLIKDYLSKLFSGTALTSFIYGNIESKNIIHLFDRFLKLFKNSSCLLPKINQLKDMTINHPNSQEKSNCIILYYPIGKFIPRESNLISLAINILSQPFFDELRTKNQLGYLVKMDRLGIRDEEYIIQKIQSEKSLDLVESKIDLFNKNLIKLIELADFTKFISTLESQLKESDYSLDEKFMRYYPEISLKQYLFNRNNILLDHLGKLTKDDLIKFVKKFITNDNKTKIIIYGN
jgi:insulysin